MSNMGDDVASATLQVSTRTAETALRATERSIELIARLLRTIIESSRKKSSNTKVKSTDLTDIKPGKVTQRELRKSANLNGDTLNFSENAINADDKKFITSRAKELGIPIAFSQAANKENIYVQIRSSDLPVYKQICTELIQEKIKAHPQELGNFKVKPWEMPHLASEYNKYDLAAQFGQTKSGEYFCLFEKKDEKAILMARGEFVRNCNEINKELSFDKDEQGFYTIKDLRSGREVSFDNVNSRLELSKQIQENFNFNKNKADIACAKFGENYLSEDEKTKFFNDDPQKEFSKIDTNINIDGESIYCKEFTCWRMTPKSDEIPKIIYNDNEGRFVILSPEKMTNRQMSKKIQQNLNIKDAAVTLALVDKANKVNDYYVAQNKENYNLKYEFSKNDFDMSNPETVSNMLRTDDDGNTFTKSLPIDRIENSIERTDKENFTVTSIAISSESDMKGKTIQNTDTQTLILSFSDKKNCISKLADVYKKQGMTGYAAVQMAKDVYKKAEMQNPEKVISIEEVKADSIILSRNDKIEEIFTQDKNKAASEISDKFEIDKMQSELLLEKSEEFRNPENTIDVQTENEKVDTNINFSEKGNNLSEISLDKALDNKPDIELPDALELPKPSIGGRK